MLDRIILLTGQTGAAELATFLKMHNPGLIVHHVATLADLVALPRDHVCRSRLIGFTTGVIVPKTILGDLGHGAYNFHPGPPSHPGWAPERFALYDGARIFGATAHRMTVKVDEGPIVGTELFAFSPDMTPGALGKEALRAALFLFRRLGPRLATDSESLPALPIEWGRFRRRRSDLMEMCRMPANLDDAEKARRSRAFGLIDPPCPGPRLVAEEHALNRQRVGRAVRRQAAFPTASPPH